MKSPVYTFDRLPVEIQRRIISYGPCESALALMKVNKTLYETCNDRLLFKSIIDNRNGPNTPNRYSHVLSINSPVHAWACYALADSKAATWSTDQPPDRFLSWVPQLTALDCKVYLLFKCPS